MRSLSSLSIRAVALAGALIAFGHDARAFDFVPIKATLAPAGEDATHNFRIVNTDSEPIAVEIRFFRIERRSGDDEERIPTNEDFFAYPPQMVIMPGESQTVRVQWLGPATLDIERAYRIVAEQLPVDLDENQSGGAQIQMLLKYEGLIYVSPEDARPDLEFRGARPARGGEDESPQLVLTLSNSGQAHGTIRNPRLILKSENGQESVLTSDQLPALSGSSVLAGAERTFHLPWPEGLPVGPVEAELSFDTES